MSAEAIYPMTPVGTVEIKTIPQRIAMQTAGPGDPFDDRNDNFRKLFGYIQSNSVAMTVPVEMGATTSTMLFYVGPDDAEKALESTQRVKVQPLEPETVVSFGQRGSYSQERFEEGRQVVEQWLTEHPEWQAVGAPYRVYWDSPFKLSFLKRSEVHQPVRKAEAAHADSLTTATLSAQSSPAGQ